MRFKSVLCSSVLLLTIRVGMAAPCSYITSHPDTWVNHKIDSVVRSARAAFDEESAELAFERLVRGIAGTLDRCKLVDDVEFAGRHNVFIDYIRMSALTTRSDHELGFLVTDREYFEQTRSFVQIPEFLLSQQFLRLASRHETLPQAKSFLHELNRTRPASEQLIFFSYRSQHLGTPDNDDSFERLLIVVPGNAEKQIPEKWVQFGITDRGARRRTRNLSIVAAFPQADGTSSVYFKDYFRTFRRDGWVTVKGRWELGEGDDPCVKCHKSGILPIFPEPGSLATTEEGSLASVNERFQSYSRARFATFVDPRVYGPGLASATAQQRIKRFGNHFVESNVGRAMTCSSCHTSQRLGAFSWPMDPVIIESFIKGGKMPLNHELTKTERDELYDKLIEEYFSTDRNNPGILKAWLLSTTR